YAAPAVPPGYCYRDYDRAYVPCAPQPSGYYREAPYYGY
ncbi:MAG: mechanosensitive ion channel protein MscS, partial [Cupriavidus sp.]|nr:mechanosensitive ion channel protein MscS [Cupriavidus sp.]